MVGRLGMLMNKSPNRFDVSSQMILGSEKIMNFTHENPNTGQTLLNSTDSAMEME